VSNILLATNVERYQIVDVKKSPFTYGELEAIGAIALANQETQILPCRCRIRCFAF
jgi:hypothetical protein